ncbi:MAG: DUF5688 family protein [Clostridiales bacterium]|nr:DUF5688 family protein [Clostridiales bacterium]
MDMELFCEEVVKCIRNMVDENVSVDVNKVCKNNGISLYGIVIRYGNEQCSPNIYMEGYLQKYQTEQVSLDEIAGEILSKREKLELEKLEPVSDLRWDNIKDKVFCRLVNREMNAERLVNIPHMEYLDLVVTCRLLHYNDNVGIASSEISYNELEVIGVTEEELFEQATQNTERLFPAEFKPLVSVMEKMMREKDVSDELIKEVLDFEDLGDKINMYILSNKMGINGAATMLYTDMLKNIATQLKTESLYLLPSSVHEWMILPEWDDVGYLKEMVADANRTAVAEIDLLSYHVYRYDRNTDMVEIAA